MTLEYHDDDGFGPPCTHEQDGNPLMCELCRAESLVGMLATLPDQLRTRFCCKVGEPWVGPGPLRGWDHDHGHTNCLLVGLAADLIEDLRVQLAVERDLNNSRLLYVLRLESWFPDGIPDGFGNPEDEELAEWVKERPDA